MGWVGALHLRSDSTFNCTHNLIWFIDDLLSRARMVLVCGSGVNGSRTGPSVIPVELLKSYNFHTFNDFAFHASTKFWGGGSHVGEQIGRNTSDFLK